MYTYISSLLSLPPTPDSQSAEWSILRYTTSCQLSILHKIVYICQCYSQFVLTSSSPPCLHVCSPMTASPFLPCKQVHLYHFFRFCIYAFVYDICFSLFDLLLSIGQNLGPSTSLQMTQLRAFLWLSSIPLYILPYLLYPFIC